MTDSEDGAWSNVLRPYNRLEAATVAEAAALAGRCKRTIRYWCNQFDIGRRVPPGGPWQVSKVALSMFLDGDREALRAYRDGDRSSANVIAYFERCGVPLRGVPAK